MVQKGFLSRRGWFQNFLWGRKKLKVRREFQELFNNNFFLFLTFNEKIFWMKELKDFVYNRDQIFKKSKNFE